MHRQRFNAQPSLFMYTAVETAAKQMKHTSKDWATLRTELI